MIETTTPPSLPPDDEISLIDIAIALGEGKRILFGVPILTTLFAAFYVLTLTPVYTATTTLAHAHAQAQYFVALMKSRTSQEALVEQFNLKQAYAVESPSTARKALGDSTRIIVDKETGVIRIEVDGKDPAFVAKLANGYVHVLHQQLDEIEVARTKQRREFYADLIQRLKSHPEDISEVGVLARARLLDIVRQKESEYAALRQSAPQVDPVLERRIRELHQLNAQLDMMEQALSPSNRTRSLDVNKVILDILTRQHEQARLDEAREPTLLQVIDLASPPDSKSKPNRIRIIVLAGVAGLFLGILIVLVRHAWRNASENPHTGERIGELKRIWGIRV